MGFGGEVGSAPDAPEIHGFRAQIFARGRKAARENKKQKREYKNNYDKPCNMLFLDTPIEHILKHEK